MEGTVNDDGVSGTATSIYYDDDIEGPIDNGSMELIDATTKSFTVLGMTVMIDDNSTVFDDGAAFETLAEGDIVEVSGYFDSTQMLIVATRVEKQDGLDDEFEVKGTVVRYDADNSTIELELQNGTAVNYDVSTSVGSEITEGAFVEVKLKDTGNGMEAIEIELDDEDLLDDNEGEVSVYGVLTGDYISGFMINDVPIDLNGTEYEPASLEGTLVDGMEVEVEGSMVDGRLIADKVEAEEEGEVEINAKVTNVIYTDNLNGTIKLDMGDDQILEVRSDNSTMLDDDSSSDTDGTFILEELVAGDFVEIEAYLNDSSEPVAKIINRKDSSGETSLEGPVEVIGDANSSISLLGITYTFDTDTTFKVDDVDTNSTAFFDGLIPGDSVEIMDVEPDGIADEVKQETEGD